MAKFSIDAIVRCWSSMRCLVIYGDAGGAQPIPPSARSDAEVPRATIVSTRAWTRNGPPAAYFRRIFSTFGDEMGTSRATLAFPLSVQRSDGLVGRAARTGASRRTPACAGGSHAGVPLRGAQANAPKRFQGHRPPPAELDAHHPELASVPLTTRIQRSNRSGGGRVIESPRAKESAHTIGRGPGIDGWCTNCGLPLHARQRFCAGCGEAVDGGWPHRRTARTSPWPLGIAVLSGVLTLVAVLLLGGALLGIGSGSLPGQSPAVTPAPEPTIAPSVLPAMPPSQEPAVNAQATPTPVPPTATPSAPDRIREARAVLDGGDAARAIELLTALKRQEVSDPSLDETLYQAYLKHGQITLGRNELDLSYAMFAEALKLKPNDPGSPGWPEAGRAGQALGEDGSHLDDRSGRVDRRP